MSKIEPVGQVFRQFSTEYERQLPDGQDNLVSWLSEAPKADAYVYDQSAIDTLQARIAELETALQHYDQALLIAFPEGAEGRVFDHWNKARSALEGKS